MAEKVNVGLVGGGKAGTPLLQELSKKPYVNIVGVADIKEDAPGMVFAKENGFSTFNDALELAKKGAELDLLVEVSGNTKVKPAIKKYFADTGNRHTIILHNLVARLLYSILTGADTIAPSYNPEDTGIGD